LACCSTARTWASPSCVSATTRLPGRGTSRRHPTGPAPYLRRINAPQTWSPSDFGLVAQYWRVSVAPNGEPTTGRGRFAEEPREAPRAPTGAPGS
jgi:hypothetical protein